MEKLDVLKISNLSLFMSEDELALLVDSYEMTQHNEGDVIFKEGEPSDKMFILISGEVEITQHMGAGERELTMLNMGECFGEMGLITEEERSATAVAKTNVLSLVLTDKKFNELLDTYPKFSKSFLQLLVQRIKHSEKIANNYILDAYHNVLFSLSNLAEARDNETGSHLFRVREYCKRLAQELSQQEQYQEIITPLFIENIYIVSPIHDIGKVAIADNILLKPGKLDKEEFSIMKLHAQYGGDILCKLMEEIDFPTFRMAYNVANHHHERFDGGGYPDGLKGEAIPIEARIMTVADVFDALLSKRVYKPAFDEIQVREIIEEENGRLFDPLLANILLDNFDEFIAIYKEYAD